LNKDKILRPIMIIEKEYRNKNAVMNTTILKNFSLKKSNIIVSP